MMSQLGCVTLDPGIVETVYSGGELSPGDQAQFLNHPRVAHDLLKNIPRMEPIAEMIARQEEDASADWESSQRDLADARLGAQIIRAALNLDALLRKGHSRVEAAHYLTKTCPGLDRKIIEALLELEPESADADARSLPIHRLVHGMVLNQEVRTSAGLLVAAKGQEVTALLIMKLQNFLAKGTINDQVAISEQKAAK